MVIQFESIRGSKVVLRPFEMGDITPEYLAWLNDPQVVRYSNQRFVHHTAESCQRYYESFTNTTNLFISIRTLGSDLRVGTMTAYVSSQHQTADIGIMIGDRSIWGGGVGQDAWNALVDWLLIKHQVRKVTSGTMRCNQPMIKLLERSGMVLEAVQPKQELLNGVPQDLLFYGKFSAG